MDRHRRVNFELVPVGADRNGRGANMGEDIACVTRQVHDTLQPGEGAR